MIPDVTGSASVCRLRNTLQNLIKNTWFPMDIAYVCRAWVLVVQGISGSKAIETGQLSVLPAQHPRSHSYLFPPEPWFFRHTQHSKGEDHQAQWFLSWDSCCHRCWQCQFIAICQSHGQSSDCVQRRSCTFCNVGAYVDFSVLLPLLPWSHWFLVLQGLTHGTHMQYPLGTMSSWSRKHSV